MKKTYLEKEIDFRGKQIADGIHNLSHHELLRFAEYYDNEKAEEIIGDNIVSEYLFKEVSTTDFLGPFIREREMIHPLKFNIGPYNMMFSGNYVVDIVAFSFEFINTFRSLPKILFPSFNNDKFKILDSIDNIAICGDIKVDNDEVELILIPINLNSMNDMPKYEEVIELIKSISQQFKDDIEMKIQCLNLQLEKINSEILTITSEAIMPMISKAVEKQKSVDYLKLN